MNEAVQFDDSGDAPRMHGRRQRASGARARRSGAALRVVPDNPRQGDLVARFDIRTVEGVEGERLAAQQAQVLWEVMAWLAQNKS
ncbi:hypothetical protein ACFYXQ_03530 [Nocardia jiangxiensis]|uniref:Uncharacterized protein n=1 Tax=Nocardia jiangxiensis TaxID=282685 RepID=A0ABW6RS55_9NOCA